MTNIILEGSEILSSKQDIRISDNIIFENANAQTPYSDRPLFLPQIRAGSSLVDLNTGTEATTVISGTRYGIVNQAVTPFAANQPPIEDDGLRGCPAFTQLAPYNESLDVWERNGDITVVNGYITKTDNNASFITTYPMLIPNQNTNQLIVFASIELIGTGSIGINMVVEGGAIPIADLVDTLTGQSYPTVVLDPVSSKKIIVRGVIQESDRTSIIMRIRSNSSPFSFKISGRGAQVSITQTEMPYVPNNTSGSISVVSEAATATTGTSFDLDNAKLLGLKTALRGPNAQGHLELTFKSNVDSGWLPSTATTNINIFTIANNIVIGAYLQKTLGGGLNIGSYDGINNSFIAIPTWVQSQVFKISLDWGTHSTGQKMRITVNGVKSTLANFNGSFGAQDLRFFFGNTLHAGWIKKDSLKVFDKPIW